MAVRPYGLSFLRGHLACSVKIGEGLTRAVLRQEAPRQAVVRNETAGIRMTPAVVAWEHITGRTLGVHPQAVLRVHTVGAGKLDHLIVNTQ